MEPLYNRHQHFVPYSEVSLTRASSIFPVGVVLRNLAVEYNVAAFSELSFPVRWQGMQSRGWYHKSNVKLLLTKAAMVDSLAEKAKRSMNVC